MDLKRYLDDAFEEILSCSYCNNRGYRLIPCDTCGETGYKGRQGLYEVMAMTPEVRRMVLRGASTAELKDQAVEDGMLTLRMDGIMKVKRGITTLEEVVKETAE